MSLNNAYIAEFNRLVELMGYLCEQNGISRKLAGTSKALRTLYNERAVISLEEYENLKDLYMIRTSVIHGMNRISNIAMEEAILKARKMMAVIERKIYFGRNRNPRV